MKINNIIKNTFVLFIITFVLGFVLSFVKYLTNDTIEQAKLNDLIIGYKQVLSDYHSNKDITDLVSTSNIESKAKLLSCYEAYDENNQKIGYIIITSISGYGGKIKIISGFDINGVLKGIVYPEVLAETPGIGMRVKEDSFINNFIGKDYSNIASVDTLTSATISSTAVKNSLIYATQIVNVCKNMY